MRQAKLGSALIMASALFLFGCNDDGPFKVEEAPRIEVSEGGRSVANGGTVSVAAAVPTRLDIRNTGTGPLNLQAFAIESIPPGAFTIESTPMPTLDTPVTVAPEASPHAFFVAFNPAVATDVARPSAVVRIRSNRTVDNSNEFVVNIAPVQSSARLVLQPPVVDFGTVQAAQSGIKQVALLNLGSADLTVTRFLFSGHPGFSLDIQGTTYTVTAESASAGVTLATPLTIAPGASQTVTVSYRALGEEAAQGSIVFFSNDPLAQGGTSLQLFSNVAGPCVKVTPSRVDFGGKLIGQLAQIDVKIESCGDRDLEIRSIFIADDPAGVFDVVDGNLGTFPLTLAPNTSVNVPVTYFPTALAQLGADGQFLRDDGLLRINSNAYLADFDVELSGFGTDGVCPTAVISVAQGDEVLPQTVLNLSARNSTASSGAITAWKWSVVQPQGSASVFVPGDSRQDVTFEANIVGEYLFRLKVWDALGTESCSEATYLVVVTSDEAIRVELLWDTPGDRDQTDTGFDFFGNSVGSDLDLHFLHASANGSWFHSLYDCNWLNINPNWGGSGALDNPRLDRDDTDGAGPENLNLSQPEFGKTYRVGVHYWDDWGFGASFATIRVYVYGQLRFQWDRVNTAMNDLWDVATIAWPTEVVTGVTTASGDPVITPNFSSGFFP